MGDFEVGHLAVDHQFFCEVCVDEGRGLIRLERWPAEVDAQSYALLRPGLAA